MDITQLINTINARIRTNGQGQITGAILNEILRSIVTTLNSGKNDTLSSGENIKTINNQSLLGSGNISIQGGSGVNRTEVNVTVGAGGIGLGDKTFSQLLAAYNNGDIVIAKLQNVPGANAVTELPLSQINEDAVITFMGTDDENRLYQVVFADDSENQCSITSIDLNGGGGEFNSVVISANRDLGRWIVNLERSEAIEIYRNFNAGNIYVLHLINDYRVILFSTIVENDNEKIFIAQDGVDTWELTISSTGNCSLSKKSNDITIPITISDFTNYAINLSDSERLKIISAFDANKNYRIVEYDEDNDETRIINGVSAIAFETGMHFSFIESLTLVEGGKRLRLGDIYMSKTSSVPDTIRVESLVI